MGPALHRRSGGRGRPEDLGDGEAEPKPKRHVILKIHADSPAGATSGGNLVCRACRARPVAGKSGSVPPATWSLQGRGLRAPAHRRCGSGAQYPPRL
jgi:hypothetical protein